MSLRKRVKELEGLVKTLQELIPNQTKAIDVLESTLIGLRKDNRDLMNRLMSQNFINYAENSPSSILEIDEEGEINESEVSQEYLAGEIVNDETE